MSAFDKLLEELDVMAKALPAGGEGGDDADKKIAAAAEDGGDADGDKSDAKDDESKDGKDGGETLGKSFTFKLDDGTEVEGVDGTELVKSLTERMDSTESVMAKALETAVTLIKAQGAEIVALKERVEKISSEGRGRKTVVSVVEKGKPLAKSEDKGMTSEQFLTKAESAMEAGRISGRDLALAESCLNRGAPVPEAIISRVVNS